VEGNARQEKHDLGLAVSILEAFRHAHVAPLFWGRASRRVLRATALLSAVSGKQSEVTNKELSRFLLSTPVPPGWTPEEWNVLAWSIRYQRGGGPKAKTGGWSKMSDEQRQEVSAWAGLLRLARGLRKCGVAAATGFRAERTQDAVHLEVPGLDDSEETASKLAAAKHLLEMYLQLPLILRASGTSVPKMPVRRAGPKPVQQPMFAEASD
jgi:exopolyphosphatase/pppGpp-phosphohydrolase